MSVQSFLIQVAQQLQPGDGSNGTINIPTIDGDQLLQNGLNLAYFIAGAIAVIMIIVAGIMFATSAGNAKSVTTAKNMILFSVVGIIVILSAWAITNFVIGRF